MPILGLVIVLCGCASSTTTRDAAPAAPALADLERLRTDAESAYEARDWPRAASAYRALIAAIPADASYWFRLGTAEARAGNPEPAVLALQEAVVREPQMSKAWYNMSIVHVRRAENALEQLIRYGRDTDPNLVRAKALLRGLAEAQRASAGVPADEDLDASVPATDVPAAAPPVPAATSGEPAAPPAEAAAANGVENVNRSSDPVTVPVQDAGEDPAASTP